MEKLEENLHLPQLSASLIASQRISSKQTIYSWHVLFTIPGPDARYNSAGSLVYENGLPRIISEMESALQKMSILETQKFSGTYSKIYSEANWPRIKLNAGNGKIWVEFACQSGTYIFWRNLTASQVQQFIDTLKTVPERGKQMVETLKQLAG